MTDLSNPNSQSIAGWLAAIVDGSDDAIISKTLDGVITTWNNGAQQIFGYRADEIVGRNIQVLVPSDRRNEEAMILERLRHGERITHFETVRLAKDGRQIPVSITVSPIKDASGRIIGASKIARDITTRKNAEEEIRKAHEAKDRFLAILSHELRTPLTPVLADIHFLETVPELPAESREEIHRMRGNIETEIRLIDDLLDLTRIGRGKISLHNEIADLHTSINHVILMCREEIDAKQIEITRELNATSHYVWGDPTRLRQILWNLLKNAVKFTPPGGKITIASANDTAGQLVLQVRDAGVGISPDVIDNIFNPFTQVDPATSSRFGGLGLGLAISRSLAELHHGSLTATSDGQGKGSTFTLSLEAIEAAASQPAVTPQPPKPLTHKNMSILLVEDHEDTVAVLSKLLRHCGYQVKWATSVHEARSLLDAGQYDLLLSDIGLPDGTGWDVMQYAQTKHLKGIAISGYGSADDLRKSQEAGFALHLTKPIAFETLESSIERVAC